jgi:type IV pilus assembly protein PilQ
MKKWTKTAGLLFMAASSVYYGQAVVAAPGKSDAAVNGGSKTPSATDVRLLEELVPAATDKSDATATTPATTATAADPKPADAPAKSEGRSVSKSEVKVSDEGTVEIHVNDASLVEVLRMLSLQAQRNIVCSKDVRGTVTANLYNVTIREALDQVLHMNGYAYREKGNFINVYTVKELQTIEDAEKKVGTEVFHLHYTPAANVLTLIKPVLSTTGQAASTTAALSGIAAGGTETGGDSHAVEDMIVVTDFPDNLEKVRKVLKEVDHRPQQVMVEATILRAALTEDNALGVDFNVLAGVKFTDFTSTAGQITGADVKAGTAPDRGGAGSIGTGNSFTNSIPGGMKVGFVSDNVNVFVAALEGVTDTVVLANPKILALNKQRGEVIVGRQDGYLTTSVTQTATVQTVEFLDTGTRLVFRPYIASDGYVRMELHPEDSSGGLTSANLPFKITTEMTSNIMVRDGHTIVIGGLFRESSSSTRSQTPFLGNIPLAGALFRNQHDTTTREEIIILLTPHVIKDDDVLDKLAEQDMKRAEKMRVGVRKGMMPWGRERLAETAYDAALAELKKPTPNNQKAMWHLDCATNLNPKFIEAIELKQKISGKEVTSVDNSSIRSYVRDMVLADHDMAPVTPVAPGSKTETDKVPAKSDDSRASADDSSDPFQEYDDAEMYDFEAHANQPEADQVVKATPDTQPTVAAAKPATQPTVATKVDEKPSETTASTTPQPDKKSSDTTPKVTVTELPTEEVKPDAPTTDENK